MSEASGGGLVTNCSHTKPRIGITIGDPSGIGPEIILKAISDPSVRSAFDLVLIGSFGIITSTSKSLGFDLEFRDHASGLSSTAIAVRSPGDLPEIAEMGVESADSGRAAARCIETSVEMWRAGEIDAISTAPISKNALALAGYKYPGHTEFFAELTGTKEFAMSFFAEPLRVVLLSTHLSLLDAIAAV